MKRILFLIGCFLIGFSSLSQESYNVNGKFFYLKTEIDGKLDLLWNTFNGHYRYFVKTEDGKIQELVNTKGDGKHFQEEYKTVLTSITGQSADKVKLTLFSLKEYINSYNASVDSSYQSQTERVKVATRLGAFGGFTNSPFAKNPENSIVPLFGAELEVFNENKLPRHAGFFSVRHQLESDDFPFSETQLAIGYRYRFINKPKFNIYGNLKIVTYSFTNFEVIYEDTDNPGTFITEDKSGSTFEAPFIFGLGADIKLGKGYITLAYQEIVALFLDMHGNFPIDFAVGYKFNL